MRRACSDVEWFEDYRVGDEFASLPVEFSVDEIISFARRYDPQLFHVDRAAAKESHFGGIVASGTHLFSAVWGGMIRAGFLNDRAMGAPGVEIRFVMPVRPGDILTSVTTVRERRSSKSRTDRGYVTFDSKVTNQRDEVVMTFSHQQIIPTRQVSATGL